MITRINIKQQVFLIATTLLAITSCNHTPHSVPFPADEPEFALPVTSPLKFSTPKKIDWVTTSPDSIKPPDVKKINFDQLPSRPFYPDGFRPLDQPMHETKFNINNLPDTTININNFPATHLPIETSILEPPVIIKAGLPKLRKNAALGIFDFNEDQGLPGSFVTAIMQDSHGMMWIATDKGLCRFNGAYLEQYSFIENIFIGSVATVYSLTEDKLGRIWIKTDLKGFYILDPKAGTVSHFYFDPAVFAFNDDHEMIMDSKGLLWTGSIRNGIYIIDPQNLTFRHLPVLHGVANGNAQQIIEDNDNNIWVGSSNGLAVINPKSPTVHFLNKSAGLLSDTITGLFMDKEKRIWVGVASEGVDIIDPKEGTIKHMGSAQGIKGVVNHFIENNDGNIWMASDNGVYIFEKSTQKIKHIDAQEGLIDNNIITILEDNSNQIWIATNSGLNLVDTKGLAPAYLTKDDGITGRDIWSFLQDDQRRIWIGSRQGVDIYNPKKQTIQSLEKDFLFKFGRTPQFIHGKNGEILLLAQGTGIDIIDPATGKVTYFTKAQGLQNTRTGSIMQDNTGRIWTGSFLNQGIEIFDPEKNSFTLINNKTGLIGSIIWYFLQDNKGQIWAASDSGVNIINPVDKTISYLMDGEKVAKYNVATLLRDEKGRIWIGSWNGMFIADQQNNSITRITTANGLCAPDIYTLFKNNGKIYVGSGNGLSVFTPRDANTASGIRQPAWDINSYGRGQGLMYTNFNAGAVLATDSTLWWGIEDKALTITKIPRNDSSVTTTYINGITISDRLENFTDNNWRDRHLPERDTVWSANKDTFYLKGKLPADTGWLQKNNISWDSVSGYYNLPVNLKIPFKQNYLSFQFTASQLSNRDKTRYRYILEGFDKTWSPAISDAYSKNYRDLPAGKYVFKVCSRGLYGNWSQHAEISFTILPPWWNTWWAYLLYIVVFGLVVGSIVQYRSRKLQKENVLLEKKVEHRTEQLKKSLEDLKSTQSQLVQSEKMASLGELTAGIAHEIQNPLNFVNNFSEVNSRINRRNER